MSVASPASPSCQRYSRSETRAGDRDPAVRVFGPQPLCHREIRVAGWPQRELIASAGTYRLHAFPPLREPGRVVQQLPHLFHRGLRACGQDEARISIISVSGADERGAVT